MGWFSYLEETCEENLVNIVIQEAKDIHTQAALIEKLLFATYILVGLEMIKLAICSYSMWKRRLKGKYNNEQPQ